MNKSKFLKKSLAMLLALMLVVAMIPLSAAAAQQPAISQAWVSDGSKARLDISGSDITGSISESARSFDLEFMVSGDVTAFYYYDQSQSNAPQKKVTLNGSTATISGLNVLDYEDESGNIVVRVSAANSVGTADYTVTLTPAAVSVNTDIKTLYVGVVTGSSTTPIPQLGPTTFDGATIKVTVPYVDSGDARCDYIIQTLELASETAVAKYIDKNGTDKGVIVPGTTVVEDGGTISVTNNGQTKNYPLEITVASGVTSLSFKEAVDTIVFPDDEKIAVLLPYGYTSTASNNNITVTPEFELDYPSATATWNGVSVVDLESGEEIKVAKTQVQSTGDSIAAFWRYGYTAGESNSEATSWTYRKANHSDEWYNTTKGFMRAGEVNTAVETMGEGGTFTIHYSDTTDRSYEVYFFETRYNSAATIESLTIGSETATIDQDAKTIDITLPAGTDAANLKLADLETKLTIKASDNATLSVPKTSANPSVVISKDPNTGSRNLTNDFTSSSKLDASDEVIVRIASQDGLTVNDYRLNVTVASDYVAPQLTDVALQNPDGTNFEPVEEKADGTIVFEVPYTSGVAPYRDGNKVAGVTSNQLAATNEDGKKVYNVFNVDLTVNEPNTGAEFSSFALNGYTGTIDQEKDTITVTLPFGTEYTYLTPTYSVSSGATVYVDDPELYHTALFSGKYQVNFTAPRHFTVISESENVTTTYTVNVVVSDEFSDVKPEDWFYNNVMDAVANGYMNGEGNGIFNPMGKTTRAAFASTIANALGYEAPEDTTTVTTRFKDVPSTHWGAGAIAFCVENEIIGGYDDGTFRPNQAITRQEAAAILNNAFDLTASTDVSKFTDANRIASWATAHVAAVANAELMNGDVDGAFRPTSTLTRAELASIMMNAKNHGYID